jgi:hypothetical protein
VTLVTSLPALPAAAKTTPNKADYYEVDANWAKLLQYSMYFYDANMCGTDVEDNNLLAWRGNCHTYDSKVPMQPIDDNHTGTNMSASFMKQYKDILDPDGDGYTNLEDYLNWIAAPNYQLAESTEISLSPWFAGYTQPSYTIAAGSHATILGDKLTVDPTGHEKMFTIAVTATEDGISLTREFYFACTKGATGIHELRDRVKPSSGWYNLNGQPMASPRQGVYIRNGKKIMR